MKKVFIVLLVLVVLALIYRLAFCYTIVTIPIVDNAYVAGSKEQFDYNILNPFLKKKLQTKYSEYIQNELKTQTDSARLKFFNNLYQSGFKIKNIKKIKDKVFVYVVHKTNTSIDGIFMYDEKKNEIIESEP